VSSVLTLSTGAAEVAMPAALPIYARAYAYVCGLSIPACVPHDPISVRGDVMGYVHMTPYIRVGDVMGETTIAHYARMRAQLHGCVQMSVSSAHICRGSPLYSQR
jgi:hypothetical protein